MSTTIVHLIRHGEVYNPERVLYGRLPGYRLSGRGVSQAARTARSLVEHDVTYLAASPLQRAQETAAPLAHALDMSIHTDERLIEAGNDLEGLRVRGVRSQLWNPQRWPMLRNPIGPSWGENYGEIADRMMEAVLHARNVAEGHEAVLVSHQLPIVMVQRTVRGLSLAHNPCLRECNLASVTSLVFDGQEITDIHYCTPAAGIQLPDTPPEEAGYRLRVCASHTRLSVCTDFFNREVDMLNSGTKRRGGHRMPCAAVTLVGLLAVEQL